MEKIGIGVNVFVFKNGRILLGKRKGGTGDGQWCLPGGKLDFGEYFHEAAVRETLEETGIRLTKLKFTNLTNDPRKEREEHYIHVNFESDTDDEPKLTEPDSFHEWEWFDLDRLPLPIFYGHRKLIEAFKGNKLLSD
jgi:8-oxo-dGTP diphosphatase